MCIDVNTLSSSIIISSIIFEWRLQSLGTVCVATQFLNLTKSNFIPFFLQLMHCVININLISLKFDEVNVISTTLPNLSFL